MGKYGKDYSEECRERKEPFDELNLACERFVPDPNSAYCLDCGYLPRDHKRAVPTTDKP